VTIQDGLVKKSIKQAKSGQAPACALYADRSDSNFNTQNT